MVSNPLSSPNELASWDSTSLGRDGYLVMMAAFLSNIVLPYRKGYWSLRGPCAKGQDGKLENLRCLCRFSK